MGNIDGFSTKYLKGSFSKIELWSATLANAMRIKLIDKIRARISNIKTFWFTLLYMALGFLALSIETQALSIDDTRHLLTRTGFSPAPHEFGIYNTMSRQQAIENVMSTIRTSSFSAPPAIAYEQFYEVNKSEAKAKDGCTLVTGDLKLAPPSDFRFRRHAEHYSLKQWWWTEMINTPSPLTERLTLMWHDHFATGYSIWAIPQFRNNQMLRSLGATDFKTLAKAILRDPAMIYYLDNYKNINTSPNENLAREFLELFTMGIGNYGENDIKELAKVLAGHGLSEEGCQYEFRQDLAFDDEITLLGKTGRFTIDQAVDIIFESPKVSEFIVKKFWIEFISPSYTTEDIAVLSKGFRDHDYDIKHLLRRVLSHEEFWADHNRGSLVKSPVELMVGMVRSFGIWMPDLALLIADSVPLGHDVFMPPNVAGWQENEGWVNPLSVVLRSAASSRLWNTADNFDELRNKYGNLDSGLMVRVSSQQFLGPRELDVFVNDELVGHFILKLGDKEDKKAGMGLLQEPEMLFIPESALPENIETVTVKYSVNKGEYDPGNHPLVMVHWVEHDGIRYNPNVATQVILDEEYKDLTNIPMGMLVYTSQISFDLEDIQKRFKKTTKDGRIFMAYNNVASIVAEVYGFGQEEKMPLTPAGLKYQELPRDRAESFKALSQNGKNELNGIPILSILPKLSEQRADGLDSTSSLHALTQSPFYQLK